MAKKSFGQHFLVNPGAADHIVRVAELAPGDRALEIGPGRGVLTERLLRTGADVTAIEADKDLEPLLRDKFPGLDLRIADATRFDFATLGDGPFTLVSNLPYNVSKPLLTRFYAERARFPRWVLMLQKELADRLLAAPGSKEWGPLTIMIQNATRIERIMDLGPQSFRPPPRVDSTVLRFTVREQFQFPLGLSAAEEKRFLDKLFQLFLERRKTLNNRMKALGGDPALLGELGLTGQERVEALPMATVVAIVRRLVGG